MDEYGSMFVFSLLLIGISIAISYNAGIDSGRSYAIRDIIMERTEIPNCEQLEDNTMITIGGITYWINDETSNGDLQAQQVNISKKED